MALRRGCQHTILDFHLPSHCQSPPVCGVCHSSPSRPYWKSSLVTSGGFTRNTDTFSSALSKKCSFLSKKCSFHNHMQRPPSLRPFPVSPAPTFQPASLRLQRQPCTSPLKTSVMWSQWWLYVASLVLGGLPVVCLSSNCPRALGAPDCQSFGSVESATQPSSHACVLIHRGVSPRAPSCGGRQHSNYDGFYSRPSFQR